MTAIENIRLSSSQKRKISITVLMVVFLISVFAGTLLVCMDKDWVFTSEGSYLKCFIKEYMPKTALNLFICSLKPILMLLTLQFVLGFFAIGQPLIIITIIVKGITSGISASAVYLEYGLKGIAVNLALLVPYVILSSFIVIIGARESLRLSAGFLSYALGKNDNNKPEVKLYFLKFAVLMFFSLIVSAADSIVTGLLDGLLIS
ncbi:MAG: stage II sporulation protein M [Porcipelethomonas sp.]